MMDTPETVMTTRAPANRRVKQIVRSLVFEEEKIQFSMTTARKKTNAVVLNVKNDNNRDGRKINY